MAAPTEVAPARELDVAALVAEARAAQERWPAAERPQLLRRAVQVMLAEQDAIVDTIRVETGKPLVEALTNELFVALDSAKWLSRNAPDILRPERVKFPQVFWKLQKRARIVYEPLGVVAVISPWNYPFALPFLQVAAALAAGNGVLLKPSELTPRTGDWVARVFERAGAPHGLLQVVHGEADVGAAVVAAPVDKILFTGSAAVGRKVALGAAERLCPVTLELGGKDAMVVFADADRPRAVAGALFAAFGNAGQTCISVERLYVERAAYEDFVAELARGARALPRDDLAPLINERQRDRTAELVADATEQGAHVVVGGAAEGERFFQPTVLADVPPEARIMREETFGPVVTVAPFDSEEEAVRLANDTEFGLGASVWTRDRARAARVASRLAAGMVWTNDYGYSFGAAQAPWGGVKGSGFGRVGSKHGLYELSRIRYVDADSGRVPVPWWFPYDDALASGFRGTFGVLYGRGLDRARSAWTERRGLARVARRYAGRG